MAADPERLAEIEARLAEATMADDLSVEYFEDVPWLRERLDAAAARAERAEQALRAARELAVAVMDKDIGEISEEARSLLGQINRTLGDLPTVEDVQDIFARAALVSPPAGRAAGREGDKT